MSPHSTRQILDLLKKRGFLKRNEKRLWQIATTISKCNRILTVKDLDTLAAHFAALDKDPESYTLAALADSTWVELVKGLDPLEPDATKDVFSGASDLVHVGPENPYGWSADGPFGKDRLKRFRDYEDTNVPSKWNGFRQCFNMTSDEKQCLGAPDHRYRGCTRAEVLGDYSLPVGWRPGMLLQDLTRKIRHPKPFFDPQEVADAALRERQSKGPT